MADDWEVTESRGAAGAPDALPEDASVPQVPAWVLERLIHTAHEDESRG